MPKVKEVKVDQEKLDDLHLLQTTLKEVCDKTKEEIIIKKDPVKKVTNHSLVIPPPPQTYVQLKKDWEYLQNDSKMLFCYLKVRF